LFASLDLPNVVQEVLDQMLRILRAGRNLPYPGFIEVSPLICCLFVK